MIRAAASGRLDFSNAESDSIRWLLRERLILQELEQEAVLELQKAKHIHMATSTVWPDFDTKGQVYKHHFAEAKKMLTSIENLLLPYDKLDKKEYYKREMDQMRAEFTAVFGDPSSPEAKAQARRDAERMAQQRLAAKQKMQNEIDMRKQQAEKLAEIRRRRDRRRRR